MLTVCSAVLLLLLVQAGSKAAGSLCCAGSQVNPIQSVSNSAFFSAAEDGNEEEGAEAEDSGLAGLGASVECSYASALQVRLRLGQDMVPLQSSVPR